MKKKTVMYTETAYVLGVVILALGTAFMALANFGVSMVVAPAYILYLKISEFLPFFTFGMAEYMLQACLIVCHDAHPRKIQSEISPVVRHHDNLWACA